MTPTSTLIQVYLREVLEYDSFFNSEEMERYVITKIEKFDNPVEYSEFRVFLTPVTTYHEAKWVIQTELKYLIFMGQYAGIYIPGVTKSLSDQIQERVMWNIKEVLGKFNEAQDGTPAKEND